MKYVISDSEYQPIVVLGNTQHFDLRQAFKNRVGAAGHFKIVDGRVSVYGESIGLGISAKPGDAEIIAAYLGLCDTQGRPLVTLSDQQAKEVSGALDNDTPRT